MKKVAQSNQKRKQREREREREREGGGGGGRKYVHQKLTAADLVEKVLMSLFLFYLHFHVVIMIIRSSNSLFPEASEGYRPSPHKNRGLQEHI